MYLFFFKHLYAHTHIFSLSLSLSLSLAHTHTHIYLYICEYYFFALSVYLLVSIPCVLQSYENTGRGFRGGRSISDDLARLIDRILYGIRLDMTRYLPTCSNRGVLYI